MQIPQPDSLPLASINRAMALFSLAAGLAFLLGGGWAIHRLHLDEFLFDHVSTQGQVVQNKAMFVAGHATAGTSARFLGGWFYRAIVRFRAPGEGDISLEDRVAWARPLFNIGQNVRIFYDPANPRHAMIDRGWKNYVAPGFVGVLGFLMILGGMQRLFRTDTSRRREPGRRR